MKVVITRQGETCLEEICTYLEQTFYQEYRCRFEQRFIETLHALAENPHMGREAFPGIRRPEYRKILCSSSNYWIYYRITQDVLAILSIRHTRMNVKPFRDLE